MNALKQAPQISLEERMDLLTPAQQAEIDRLSRKFDDILPEIYCNLDGDGDKAALAEANRKYDAVVKELEAIVGVDGPCHLLDPDAWEVYHNVYKSDEGVRPRGMLTRAEVEAYLAARRDPPKAA
jgi:hypothetical protein